MNSQDVDKQAQKTIEIADRKYRLVELSEEEPTDPAPEAPKIEKTQKNIQYMKLVAFNVQMAPEAHKQLQLLKINTGKSIRELVIQGINEVFKLHKMPPIA